MHIQIREPRKLIALQNAATVDDSSINSTAKPNKQASLYLYDRTNNFRYLIDSGSIISLLPRRAIKQFLKRDDLTLYATNLTSINTYGEHIINVNLGLRRNLKWPFIIADMPEALIGTDFLMEHNLLIDLKNQQLIDSQTGLTTRGRKINTTIHSISAIHSSMQYNDLLKEFIEITKCNVYHHDSNSDFTHQIVTNGQPVSERFRKLSGEKATTARKGIQKLLDGGILRPSSSAWASPIHFVKKKDENYRLCGDYRKLNHITIPDKYSPLLIQSLFELIPGKTIFTKIDRSGKSVPSNTDAS